MTATTQIDEPKAWQAVLRHVEQLLGTGELPLGAHLPPERALATDLGVGRSSVREAYRVLEAMGLVRTQAGSGPTSGATVVAAAGAAMASLLRMHLAAQGFPVADLVDTRIVLERSVASDLAAAAPGSDPDLTDARRLLDAMDDPGLAAEEFLDLDQGFHLALADATGNAVTAAIMSGLRGSIAGYVRAGLPEIESWPRTAHRLRLEHRGILAAIDDRDPAAASERVEAHITGYYAQVSPLPATGEPR